MTTLLAILSMSYGIYIESECGNDEGNEKNNKKQTEVISEDNIKEMCSILVRYDFVNLT